MVIDGAKFTCSVYHDEVRFMLVIPKACSRPSPPTRLVFARAPKVEGPPEQTPLDMQGHDQTPIAQHKLFLTRVAQRVRPILNLRLIASTTTAFIRPIHRRVMSQILSRESVTTVSMSVLVFDVVSARMSS